MKEQLKGRTKTEPPPQCGLEIVKGAWCTLDEGHDDDPRYLAHSAIFVIGRKWHRVTRDEWGIQQQEGRNELHPEKGKRGVGRPRKNPKPERPTERPVDRRAEPKAMIG